MNLYKLTCSHHDYDEYDGFIVAADNPKEALALIQSVPSYDRAYHHGSIKKIATASKEVVKGIVLESFNAG